MGTIRTFLGIALPTLIGLVCLAPATAAGAEPIPGVECTTPPPAHCGESCSRELLGELGNVVEPKTGRAFFLDYPCDLKEDEEVLLILSLHGAGSIGNWQRHYFPALDYVDQYRLVVATPTAATSRAIFPDSPPVRMWVGEEDDEYLHNIVDWVFEHVGRERIKSFWLAGHSQGGMTSNRIVCTDFFADKVDGWLSLSGGRIGRAEIAPDFFGPNGPPAALRSTDDNTPRPGFAVTPKCDISFIFTSGDQEIVALPETSPLAEADGCSARERRPDIVDEEKGYVTGQRPGRGAAWGLAARPGTAEEYVYPGCRDGRLVADVLRLDKGHTEGLEPRVTEELIKLMVGAPGGKARRAD